MITGYQLSQKQRELDQGTYRVGQAEQLIDAYIKIASSRIC